MNYDYGSNEVLLPNASLHREQRQEQEQQNKQQLRSIEFKINICVLLIVTWCLLVSLNSRFLGPIYPLSSASIIGTYSSVSSSSPSTYYNSSNFETETLDSDSVSVLIVFIDNDEAQLYWWRTRQRKGASSIKNITVVTTTVSNAKIRSSFGSGRCHPWIVC